MKKGLVILMTTIYLIIIMTVFIHPLMTNRVINAKAHNVKLNEAETISIDFEKDASFRDSAYYKTYNEWLKKYKVVNLNSEIKYSIEAQTIISNPNVKFEDDGVEKYALLNKKDEITFEIEVAKTGLYELGLEFKTIDNFTTNPNVSIKINDEYPFNELSDIFLEVNWLLEKRTEDKRYNRYGNELLPYSKSVDKWYKHYLDDVNNRYRNPYKVLLLEGKNKVTITNLSEKLKVKNIYLFNTLELVDYKSYLSNYQNVEKINNKITIQGEDLKYKNDIEIKSSYYKDPSMTPNAYKNTILNMLDGSSSAVGGRCATYEFEVEESGMYCLSFKYLQNTLNGLTVSKAIYIDGVIPFKEFQSYQFEETSSWKNHTLNDGKNNYYIYIEKGTHTLSLETTLVQYNDYIEKLYYVMDKINNLGLDISSITGSSTNQHTSWDIVKYIPTISEDLNSYADIVDEVYDGIKSLSRNNTTPSEISTLKIASKQLRRLAIKPNQVHLKLTELNSGSGSSYQLIGTSIGILLNQPMSIDCMYLTSGDVKLPKAKANFFVKLWFNVKSFFYSFFDERYKVEANNDDNTLDVWVAQSNLYLDIIQSMTDDEFTRQTNIDVKINLLPSSQKIVLNNATNTNPDVVLSIDSWEPYNYALRGMLEDLSKYDGFDDVTKNIYSNCFIPVIYDEGVYAIPETTGLNILFYRKDILNYLGLEVPRTWEDVLNMLPILQSYQMNFYHPLGAETSYKSYNATSPFIYGFGGEIFSDNGMTSVLNDEKVIDAITFMTDLFNVHNLPRQVSSFFEHFRSGTLPIGVGTIGMYLDLKYASPELSGQWGMIPVPGFDSDLDGEAESWTTAYGKASILFKSSNMKKEGWEFIKWWNKTETQIKYLQNIKMCLGEKYLIIPANVDALYASPWDQELKTQVEYACKYSRIPAILPGSYAVEREFSNIWNKVVIDLVDVRVAAMEGVTKVNKELTRKFTEFGYIKDGKVVKEYIVPNNSNVFNWVKGRDYYEKYK